MAPDIFYCPTGFGGHFAWRRLVERSVLADGTVVDRDVPYCYMVLPQGESYSPVVLRAAPVVLRAAPVVLRAEGDSQALLGAVTLGNLGLRLNPFSRTLHPMRLHWRS